VSTNNSFLLGTGDLNRDGRPDILYTNVELLGKSDGTFQTVPLTQAFGVGSSLADINGDGKLDVIEPLNNGEECDLLPDGTPNCFINGSASVQIFLGKGDGTFQSPASVVLGQAGAAQPTMSVLDLNGDGRLDIIVHYFGDPLDPTSNATYTLLNDGNGNFHQPPTPVLLPLGGGDFNGDGKLDLVYEGGVTLGKGDGTFGPLITFPSGVGGFAAAVGDFNHDGRADIALLSTIGNNSNPAYRVSLLTGKGDGTFLSPKVIPSLPFRATGIVAADLNHDGYLDLVAGGYEFAVVTNLRNGAFSGPKAYYPLGGSSFFAGALSFALADFDLDGNPDVVSGNLISHGSSSGIFAAPRSPPLQLCSTWRRATSMLTALKTS
jgi:hypothetical protein